MIRWTVLRPLLIASFLMAGSAVCAAGRDQVIPNPNPNRTWGRMVGGVFTSGKSIAVVIAISNYIGERAGGYPALPTAKHDADKMVDFLIKDAGFDIVYVLTDEHATREKIDKLMTDVIPGTITSFDRFLFYWSGHGDQRLSADGRRAFGFLPLADSKRQEFSKMISMKDLERWDGYLDARHALFVLDACLSGLAGVEKKSPGDARSEQLSLPAHHLLTAGTARETVISSDKWGGSLFTDSFILGAKGQARSSSGIVSLFSLIDFIQERVVIEKQAANWSRSLTPQLQSLQAGDGAFYFNPPQIAGLTSNAPRTAPPIERKGDNAPTTADPQQQANLTSLSPSAVKNSRSFRLTSSYVRVLSDLFEPSEQFVREVQRATSERLKVSLFSAGQIVPGLQVLDAVKGGTVELGWTYAGYFISKEPALAAVAGGIPLGINGTAFVHWLEGNGQVVRDQLFAELGVKAFPCSIAGASGLWLRKEVRRVDDMRGLKLRVGGYAGAAMQSMGAIPQQLAGGDIYPALENGTIDGLEWQTPNIDESLGWYKVAKYYYYPFGEPSFSIISDLIINRNIWNELEPAAQVVIRNFCQQQLRSDLWKLSGGARPEALAALERMRAAGTVITRLPEPIAARYRELAGERLDRDIKSAAGLEVWRSLKTAR